MRLDSLARVSMTDESVSEPGASERSSGETLQGGKMSWVIGAGEDVSPIKHRLESDDRRSKSCLACMSCLRSRTQVPALAPLRRLLRPEDDREIQQPPPRVTPSMARANHHGTVTCRK